MKSTYSWLSTVVLVLIGLSLVVTGSAAAQSADIVVATDGTGDYSSIQAGIDNAAQNDTIEIRPGTYSESVDIDKNVHIVAPDGATITPPTGAVSAVAIGDEAEPRLENLTLTGDSSIGFDARSTNSDWTATGLNIAGFDFGIVAQNSKGEWVLDDSTIENSNVRGISADESENNWTVNSTVIRDVSGIGVDAYRTEAGAIQNTEIINVTQNDGDNGDGILLYDTGGDWVVDNVTVTNVEGPGINAGDTNATHAPVIKDTTVVETSEEGLDIAGSESDVQIIGATIRYTGENAIRIENARGDWAIEDTVIETVLGEGIDAYNQPESSHATIRNLTVADTQNHGVNFYNSTGDWELIDSHISNSETKGVEAGDTTGNWSIASTTVETTEGVLIEASGATGKWEVHESTLATGGKALNATEAVEGNASYNYWGAADGPSGDFSGSGSVAVGNATIIPYYTDPSLTTLSSEQGGTGGNNNTDSAPGDVTGNGEVATDTDGDGLYEDVDGNGNVNFDDAVALAFVGGLTDAQQSAFDFDGDGDVDFDDAVELAFGV